MSKIRKIIIGSNNPSKVNRFRKILLKYAYEVVSLKELGIKNKPKEEGGSAEKNAEIKAVFFHKITGLPVFTEDEALFVNFLPLDKQPGVFVRRINGREDVDDKILLKYWEGIVAGVPKSKRVGYWHIAYCICDAKGRLKTFSLNHPIMFFSPSSKIVLPGWPMSSLEGPLDLGKPDSELSMEERKRTELKTDLEISKKLVSLFE